jgi:hypothetical protein
MRWARLHLFFSTVILCGLACGPRATVVAPAAASSSAPPATRVSEVPSASTSTASSAPVVVASASTTTIAKKTQCGRLPSEPIEKLTTSWGPHPKCDDLATRWANVPHEDRVCEADSDCVAHTSDGHCWNDALNAKASKKPAYKEYPCGNPASGACGGPKGDHHAKCDGGCCVIAG